MVLADTLAAAATAIREARNAGLIAHGTAIWLCDDTPADKPKCDSSPAFMMTHKRVIPDHVHS